MIFKFKFNFDCFSFFSRWQKCFSSNGSKSRDDVRRFSGCIFTVYIPMPFAVLPKISRKYFMRHVKALLVSHRYMERGINSFHHMSIAPNTIRRLVWATCNTQYQLAEQQVAFRMQYNENVISHSFLPLHPSAVHSIFSVPNHRTINFNNQPFD